MTLPRLKSFTASACLLGAVLSAPRASAEDNIKQERYKPALPVIELFKQGCKKFEFHEYADGESVLNAAIKLDPKFASPYYVRACCRHLQNNYEGALEDCNTSITLEPNGNPIVYFERAVAEYRLNQLDECIKDFDIALKRAPKFPGSYIYRAHAKSNKGDREGALRDCETYLQADPHDEQALKFHKRLQAGG